MTYHVRLLGGPMDGTELDVEGTVVKIPVQTSAQEIDVTEVVVPWKTTRYEFQGHYGEDSLPLLEWEHLARGWIT